MGTEERVSGVCHRKKINEMMVTRRPHKSALSIGLECSLHMMHHGLSYQLSFGFVCGTFPLALMLSVNSVETAAHGDGHAWQTEVKTLCFRALLKY